MLLPALFALFPRRPGFGGFVYDALGDGGFGGGLAGEGFADAFAVDEGAARGDGEEEEAHGGFSLVMGRYDSEAVRLSRRHFGGEVVYLWCQQVDLQDNFKEAQRVTSILCASQSR